MALSRLLISGTKLHRHSKGFPTPTRWFSSSSSANSNNTTENESINTDFGNVQEPFYLIKAIKEKVSSSWIGKTLTSSVHDTKEDRISATAANASEVTKAGKKLDTAAPDERSSSQLSEKTDSTYHGSEATTNTTSDFISDEFSGDSVSSTDSSEKEKIVDMPDRYQQSEVDPKSDMALKRDQEAASKDLGVTGLNEVTLTEGKDCLSNVKSMECLASDEHYEQKETSSSCSSVQMTTSNHQKSLTGGSAESFIDPIARDIIKDEKLPVFKLDEQIGRNITSNSARPVGQGNGYRQYKVDQGAVRYRDGNQEEAAECVQPNSDRLKRPSCLDDLLDDDNDSGVKGLLDLVKRFHRGTSQSSDDNNTNSANTPNNSYRSKDRNEAVVTNKTLKHPDQVKRKTSLHEQFMQGKTENQIQHESPMQMQKERSASEMLMTTRILNEHGHTSTSDDAALVCKMSKPSLAIPGDSGLKNVHENGSKSDDAASDCKLSKQGPFLVDSGVKNMQKNASESDDATLKCKMPKPRTSIPIDSGIKNLHENGNESDDAASFCSISKQTPQITFPSLSKSSKTGLKALLLTEKDRIQTDVLVRFIPKTQDEKQLIEAFASCGPIDEVHFISSDNEKLFKNAYVRFKTREGMRNALSGMDTILVGKSDVLVEALSSSVYTSPRIHPPNLIGIPGVPPSLVMNPTRTVMVKGLTHEISSRHLDHAFSFCGRITGFFMGSSSSVGYIEFKTEAAKEKAIESYSILVPGSKLLIFRIDTPCTTVVRILSGVRSSKMTAICREYGNVSIATKRSSVITDVHYAYSEWPKMVNILNSLNGLVVDGHRWSVMPAPLIPVEILQSLWRQPDGRRRLHDLLQNICCKIEEVSMAEVKDLVGKYYGEGTETFQS